MGRVSAAEFHEDVARYLEAAADEPVVIDRQDGKPSLVVMSLAEYESWRETSYLLESPANAERLLGSVRRINSQSEGQNEASNPR